MAVSLQSFTQIVQASAAAAQGACATLLDFTVGSVARSITEATAGQVLWLQYLVIQILARTRLSTSTGADVDSFVNDFGVTREGAVAATGTVTLISLNPNGQAATVPVGATVRTTSAITFAITQDTTNPVWSASAGAYIRPLGTLSITVPVQAQAAGSSGNVATGAINVLGTAISGIDTCSNAAPFSNGADGETDAALRSRFVGFINSRSLATPLAIGNAIAGVQTDLTYQIAENVDTFGNYRPGFFVAYVDDGSGNPPATTLATVYAAINAVRPAGVAFAVQPPSVLPATVVMVVNVASTANADTVTAAIQAAIAAYLTSLPVGQPASYYQLTVIAAQTAGTSLAGIVSVILNGGQANVGGVFGQAVRAASITVTPA